MQPDGSRGTLRQPDFQVPGARLGVQLLPCCVQGTLDTQEINKASAAEEQHSRCSLSRLVLGARALNELWGNGQYMGNLHTPALDVFGLR